jgi:hypothetical protein
MHKGLSLKGFSSRYSAPGAEIMARTKTQPWHR